MMMRSNVDRLLAAVIGTALLATGCGNGDIGSAGNSPAAGSSHRAQQGQQIQPAQTSEADWKGVAEALGRPGKLSGGTTYRVGFPRSDLNVTAEGVQIKPGLALGSYAVFTRYADGRTLMMGDLVVTEDELQRVTDALHANNIDQTAVHKHLLAHQPQVWWTHIHTVGDDPAAMARGVRAVLDTTTTPPPVTAAPAPELGLNTAAIDAALGTPGKNDGGIYKFSFARKETVSDHGRVLPSGMGVTTAINFQPTGSGKAAISGDVAMTAEEVQKVIKALRAGGIQIVELHNHSLQDEPRLFYLHFWANDDAVKLARAWRKALDAHNVTPTG